MSMPETSLDLDYCAVFWQNNIRASRQSAHMQPEAEAETVERPPDQHFGLRVR
jgi:hypothetical protein